MTGAFSLLVIVGVFATLMIPAISMEQNAPLLEANPASAEVGKSLSVKVTASAQAKDDSVFVLSETALGGKLAERYVFDDKGTARLETTEGQEVLLHRVDKTKGPAERVAIAEQAIADARTNDVVDASQATADAMAVAVGGKQADAAGVSEDVVEAENSVLPMSGGGDAAAASDSADEPKSVGEKSLYWFVVPRGSSVTFMVDYVSVDAIAVEPSKAQAEVEQGPASEEEEAEGESAGAEDAASEQHSVRLFGASGVTYSKAIQSLSDFDAKKDEPGAAKEGRILDIEWVAPTSAGADKASSGDAAAVAGEAKDASAATGDPAVQTNLTDQTITAKLYADASETTASTAQGVIITLQGKLPEGARASAHPIEAEIDDQTVLAAYDGSSMTTEGSMARPRGSFIGGLLSVAGILLVASAVALAFHNVMLDRGSRQAQAPILSELEAYVAGASRGAPEGNMPVAEVDGIQYVGILEIPSLGLSLPVQSTWDDDTAEVTVCRWSGTAYDDDLVIAGKAYSSQLGDVGDLRGGDEVVLTDMYGNRFEYRVVGLQEAFEGILREGEEQDADSLDGFDLSLCTYSSGGLSGLTVGCRRVS